MKKTALINSFRVTEKSKQFVLKLQKESPFGAKQSDIASTIFELGIEAFKKKHKGKYD